MRGMGWDRGSRTDYLTKTGRWTVRVLLLIGPVWGLLGLGPLLAVTGLVLLWRASDWTRDEKTVSTLILLSAIVVAIAAATVVGLTAPWSDLSDGGAWLVYAVSMYLPLGLALVVFMPLSGVYLLSRKRLERGLNRLPRWAIN